MKCIKNKIDGKIRRVENDQATALVKLGAYNYCSKQEWKNKGAKHEPVAPVIEEAPVKKAKKVKKTQEEKDAAKVAKAQAYVAARQAMNVKAEKKA